MNVDKEKIKDLDKVEPIDYGVVAKPHTPIYKMHRYFARRPYTVFNELIKHYSNPESIVLDPMCGGGVTIVEGLKLRRKVIGVDLNPMAIFITKCEVMDVDLNKLRQVFQEISEKVKDEINSLYLTKCPKCNKEVSADWFEWSTVVECRCGKEVVFASAKKLRAGTYECPHCKIPIKSLTAKRKPDRIVRLKLKCDKCGFKGEKKPDKYDFEKYQWIEENFDKIVKEQDLWYPKDKIFLGEKTRELLTKDYKYFYELFTKRNLLSLSILLDAISRIKEKETQELLCLAFSSGLFEMSTLSHLKGRTVVKPGHHYWLANIFAEVNAWGYFENRYGAVYRGKKNSGVEIGEIYKKAKTFKDITNNKATCWLLAQSATDLKGIPNESVDVIITDPPYGANVNYTELSDFWTIWIRDIIGVKNGLIDNTKEAIENKYQEKGSREYRQLMCEIFKECYRVLKPNRWLVMTFHNRNFKVWNAIQLAAHDAGFIWSEKDGMIYQPPIQAYITTLHQQSAGAMLGDFILSYKKTEKPPKEKWIEEVEVDKKIRDIAREAVEYHGGAKLTTIYMKVMPFLLNNGLLEQIKEDDLEIYLTKDFVKRNNKWYLKEHIDKETGGLLDKTIEEYALVKIRLGSIIKRHLLENKNATLDEILQIVYSSLINGDAAEYEEIDHVLNRICEKRKVSGWKREVWQLKEKRIGTSLFNIIKERDGEDGYSAESEHDVMIEQLVYDSHIGMTEQKKDKRFRDLSIPMGSNVQFGLNEKAFNRIREIDVLWVKGISIIAAFEVEKSREVESEIAKFRELFAATPVLNVPTYLVVPDKLEENANKKIGSLANRREKLTKRIKYVLFSDVQSKRNVDIDQIAKRVL
ncbi:MAG: hypothetical protein HY769_10640 [Candidatus Stahlbacteria bacterium]|nr:hypothetical protein [Candidatus Stahlbacteria bacterium]